MWLGLAAVGGEGAVEADDVVVGVAAGRGQEADPRPLGLGQAEHVVVEQGVARLHREAAAAEGDDLAGCRLHEEMFVARRRRGRCTAVRSSARGARPGVQQAQLVARPGAAAPSRSPRGCRGGGRSPPGSGPPRSASPAAGGRVRSAAPAPRAGRRARPPPAPARPRRPRGTRSSLSDRGAPGRAGGRPRCGRSSPASGCGWRDRAGSSADARPGAGHPELCLRLRSDCSRSDRPIEDRSSVPHPTPSHRRSRGDALSEC